MTARGRDRSLIAALLLSVYLVTGSGGFHIVDEVSLFALTESLAKRGAWDTNAIAWTQWVNSPGEVLGAIGASGDVYSKKGPAPAALAVPLHWLAQALSGVGLLNGTFLLNSLVTVATALLLLATATALGYRPAVGRALALAFGLGTLAWPYALHFFGEPVSALALLLAFYALLRYIVGAGFKPAPTGRDDHGGATGRVHPHSKTGAQGRVVWPGVAGLALGVALATNVAHAALFPLFVIYLWTGQPSQRLRATIALALPLLGIAALLGTYNLLRFGNALDTGYHFDAGEGFNAPWLQGLWGLTLSPYRGLLWYVPLVWGSLAAWPSFIRRQRAAGWLLAGVCAGMVALFAGWWMWWGGFAWGPRFLVPLMPFLVLPLAEAFDRFMEWPRWGRVALAALLALSVGVQVLAVSMNYTVYETQLREIYPTDWRDPLRYGPPALFNFAHSPILGQLRTLSRAHADPWPLHANPGGGVVWAGPLLAALVFAAVGIGWRTRRRLPVLLALGLTLALAGVTLRAQHGDPRYGVAGAGYRAALDEIRQQAGPDDAIVTVAPYHYHIPMNHDRSRLPVFGFAPEAWPLRTEVDRLLERAVQAHARLWLVTAGLPPADPANGVELWLAQGAYKAGDVWYNDVRLVPFITRAQTGTAQPVGVALGAVVELVDAATTAAAQPGDAIVVDLHWRALAPPSVNASVFVQLLDGGGQLWAQHDGAPVGGYRPLTTWQAGEDVHDRHGLLLPADAPPGAYRLIVGLYDPATGGRLLTAAGADYVELATVTVR